MTLIFKKIRHADPKHRCAFEGCTELTHGRYCEGHVRQAFPRNMSTVNKNRGAFKFDHDSVRYG